MERLAVDANQYFSAAREGDTGIQQEHIGMEMLIFLMNREHTIFNECLEVRNRKPRKRIRKLPNKQNYVVVVVYAVSDRVVMYFVFCFVLVFFKTILFYHTIEDFCSSKPSARLLPDQPLVKPR